jgi:hypothetical protein
VRLGVDAASLKAKHGTPKFLLDSPKVTFFHGGLRVPYTPLTRRVIKEFDQRKTLKNQNELWRASFSFWRHIILSAWKHDHARIHDTLKRKLDLLLQAAERENKYHAVTLNLTRWIDAQVRHYHLRTTINALSKQHTGRDADWPSFKDTLPESFQRKEKRTTR